MENLIELVQKNEVLYNINHNDYVRAKYKDKIWDRIARELDYPDGKVVKDKWRKLRECHREALRRQHVKTGSGSTINKLWQYQKQMEFLLPFMKRRPAFVTYKDPHDKIEHISLSMDPFQEESAEENSIAAIPDLQWEESTHEESYTQEESYLQPVVEQEPGPSEITQRVEVRREEEEKITKAKRKLEPIRQTSGKRGRPSDASKQVFLSKADESMYHFFMSMYNITKTMPSAFQRSVRRQIFDTVTQAEEEAAVFEVPSPETFTFSSSPIAEESAAIYIKNEIE